MALKFTGLAGQNSVLSGLFFGGPWNGLPSASILPTYNATAGFVTLFQGSALDSDRAETAAGFTFQWNFGDGTTTTGRNLSATSHTYAAPGNYTVQLTVVDQKGEQSTDSIPVVVGNTGIATPLDKPIPDNPNFTLLGSFLMPTSANGTDTAYSTGGLTYRYMNGQLHFLTTTTVLSGGLVYETNDPGIGSGDNQPQAQVLKNWGDVYTGHKALQDSQVGGDHWTSQLSGGIATYGLSYDQESNRLYWTYGDWYNAEFPNNPSFGYSTLNDATGVGTGVGAWSLTNRYEKFNRGGVLQIPKWFANQYTGGDTLGVGFGGYFSITNTASFGPALAAVAPPDPASNPDDSSLSNVPLLGYPTSQNSRANRDANYTSYYDGGVYPTTPGASNPSNGVGQWTWSDIIYGAGTWIDTPQLGGVLFIAKVGQGDVWYEHSERHAQGSAFEWMVYSPQDLAAVASGAKQQWEIQPKYEWTTPTLPVGPTDQSGYGGEGLSQVGGVTFDPTTDRLYVQVNGAWQNGTEYFPKVYVYQVGVSNIGTLAQSSGVMTDRSTAPAPVAKAAISSVVLTDRSTAPPAVAMAANGLPLSATVPAAVAGPARLAASVVEPMVLNDPIVFDAAVVALEERRGTLQLADQDDLARALLS